MKQKIREQQQDINNLKMALKMAKSEANEYRNVLTENVGAVIEKHIDDVYMEDTVMELTTITFPRTILGGEYSKELLRDINKTLDKYDE